MTARAIIVSTLASLALVLPTSLSFSMSSADVSSPSQPKTVIIAGAGVIGTSTAYYLAKNFNVKSILVDVTGQIAPAASGKAGGFLALDWNDHTPPLGRLARRSFALHEELAKGFGYEKIMYRRLTCASISVDPTKSLKGFLTKPLDLQLDPLGKQNDNWGWSDARGTGHTCGR